MGDIPPTGKEIAIDIVDIVRFQDGMAVERWAVGDEIGIMRQLGLMPEWGA